MTDPSTKRRTDRLTDQSTDRSTDQNGSVSGFPDFGFLVFWETVVNQLDFEGSGFFFQPPCWVWRPRKSWLYQDDLDCLEKV